MRGKNSGFVTPNLLTLQRSDVALDVKGERFQTTARHRAAQGDMVYRLAPNYWDDKRTTATTRCRASMSLRIRHGSRWDVIIMEQLDKISGKTPLIKAIRYALAGLPKARPYHDNGFLEIDNNTAERAVRPVAVGRKNYFFMESNAGGKSAAIAYTLIETAKMNNVNPEAWLAWVLERN